MSFELIAGKTIYRIDPLDPTAIQERDNRPSARWHWFHTYADADQARRALLSLADAREQYRAEAARADHVNQLRRYDED